MRDVAATTVDALLRPQDLAEQHAKTEQIDSPNDDEVPCT